MIDFHLSGIGQGNLHKIQVIPELKLLLHPNNIRTTTILLITQPEKRTIYLRHTLYLDAKMAIKCQILLTKVPLKID